MLFCEGGFGIGWEREEEEKKIEERLMKVIHHSNLQQRRGKGEKGDGGEVGDLPNIAKKIEMNLHLQLQGWFVKHPKKGHFFISFVAISILGPEFGILFRLFLRSGGGGGGGRT